MIDKIDEALIEFDVQREVNKLLSDADPGSLIVFQALNAALTINMIAEGSDHVAGLMQLMKSLETIVGLSDERSQAKGVEMFDTLHNYVTDIGKTYE